MEAVIEVDASPEAKAVKKLPIDQVSKVPLQARSDIDRLDLPEGLKKLLEDKKCDLNFLIQVAPSVLAQQLGIDEDVSNDNKCGKGSGLEVNYY